MAKKGWPVSLVLLLAGVASSFEALRLGLGGLHRPGVGFLPFLVGSCLTVIAFFSFIIDIRAIPRHTPQKKVSSASPAKLVSVVCCLAVYVLVLSTAGYLLSTFLLFVFLFRTGGVHKWSVAAAAALLTSAISYCIFGFLLNIRFPKGLLGI